MDGTKRNVLILRKPRSGCLEGRRTVIQLGEALDADDVAVVGY